MTIHLTVEQCNLLISIITSHIGALREEIGRTETYAFKANLKNQKHELEELLTNLMKKKDLIEEPVHG